MASSAANVQVIPPAKLEEILAQSAKALAESKDAAAEKLSSTKIDEASLAGYIRKQFAMMRRHRDSPERGWSHRLVAALQAFNGKYPAEKLAEIKKFGGSDVYARIVAAKCRGASALLRDIYLSPDRAWQISPPADPDVPGETMAKIIQLTQLEAADLQNAGLPITTEMIKERVRQLYLAARNAEKKAAKKRAVLATDKIDEILTDGGFYHALSDIIADLVMYPFAILKGPIVRIVPVVRWNKQQLMGSTSLSSVQQEARMFWERVSPFDVWWTPGASSIEDAAVIERVRYTRTDLNDLLDLPGYNHGNVRKVLMDYGTSGYVEVQDQTDEKRAIEESKESPIWNESGIIEGLEYSGPVQGKHLIEWGITSLDLAATPVVANDNDAEEMVPSLSGGMGMGPQRMGDAEPELGGASDLAEDMAEQAIPTGDIDPERDYMAKVWLIGPYILKVQLSPSPRKRHNYKATSFEKVPGTIVGNALPDILGDIADVANATLRALVNNEAIASGPQVVINTDRMAPGENASELFPWKRWFMLSDPLGNNAQDPVSFFQPKSNASELLTVYKELVSMADDLSAIPRYLTGAGAGGAGRTSSGLAMLLSNASKILQTVAANVDGDIISGTLIDLYDMIMLTDESELLQGDESISVLGVAVAQQRETERVRQLEFLQITANPIDLQIMGVPGRSEVLRSVASTIGLVGENIVPDVPTGGVPPDQPQPKQIGQGGEGGQQAPQPSGESAKAQAPRESLAS